MHRGRIAEQGEADQVFTAPTAAYTVQLLGAIAGKDLAGAGRRAP